MLINNSDDYDHRTDHDHEPIRHFDTLNRYKQKLFIDDKIKEYIENAKYELEKNHGEKLSYNAFKSKEEELERSIIQAIRSEFKLKPKKFKKYLNMQQIEVLIKLTVELSSFSEAKKNFCSQTHMHFDEEELHIALQVNDPHLSHSFNNLKAEVKLEHLKKFNLLHVGTSNYLCKDKVHDFFTRLEKLVKLADSLDELSVLQHKNLQDEKVQPLKYLALEKSEQYIDIGYKCNCWQPEASALKDAGFKNIDILKELNDDRITSDALKSFLYKVSNARKSVK